MTSDEERAFDAIKRRQDAVLKLSAGALALSITFRSTLIPAHPADIWLLKMSWLGLMIAIVSGLMEMSFLGSLFEAKRDGEIHRMRMWVKGTGYVNAVAFSLGMWGLLHFALLNTK